REFLTALVVPEMETLRSEVKARGIAASSQDEILAHETVRSLYADLFRAQAREAASHEKVRDFRFVAEPFSVENDLLTPTMKLKRKAIEAQYADLVDDMYAGVV
ncbi:MAG: long-chain fatty acid--CoA ligase, partial [Bacteroidota bacterium]